MNKIERLLMSFLLSYIVLFLILTFFVIFYLFPEVAEAFSNFTGTEGGVDLSCFILSFAVAMLISPAAWFLALSILNELYFKDEEAKESGE